ncbi:MULE transposase domain-containing protein [Hirschfeldia incana]|nr:MULE transposase domain-containing protein [Hirschfeldia incana]
MCQIRLFEDVEAVDCSMALFRKVETQSETNKARDGIRDYERIQSVREYNLSVTDEQCGKAKTKVLRERNASHENHFARIWDYQAEVLQTNKGTKFEIETIPGPTVGSKQRFYRLFICFTSQRESWKKTCRPIIGLDGAFLKWDIKGHLLAAVGRDGDNRIVPIAWAVVEIENDDNWDWFVKRLSHTLGLDDGRNVAIISDKQKGLVKAIHNVLPSAEHRQCCKHIMDNWKKDSNNLQLKRLFWKIARSYTRGEYDANMEALQKYNPNAFTSLQKTNPPSWSRAYFRTGYYCNDNLNNLSESFNRTIRQARRKPLLDMLEDIRRQCMVRNAKRSIIAERLKTKFTKRAHAEIEKMIAGTQHCIRHMARNNFHEVELNDFAYSVDMTSWSCGCRKWAMVGIPCVHAAAVIIGRRQQVGDYVSDYYKTKTWQETYKTGIRPVQGMLLWPRLNRLPILPPPWRNGDPGRPSNYARKKGRYETAASSSNTRLSRALRVTTCSNCKQEGHNKKRCPNETAAPEAKRPRSRPRKNQFKNTRVVSRSSTRTRVVSRSSTRTRFTRLDFLAQLKNFGCGSWFVV